MCSLHTSISIMSADFPFSLRRRSRSRSGRRGEWLYGTASEAILAPLLRPPLLADDLLARYRVHELRSGAQEIASVPVTADPQPNHWSPSAGFRLADALAVITDTPYELSSAELAAGVSHLLHEAWSSAAAPINPEYDATAEDAARVARDAGVEALTLIHLNPRADDLSEITTEAKAIFENSQLGTDLMTIDA
jgi:ribonuclease BN (tRNA processing enzyme)